MTTFYFILLIFINSLYHLCAMYMPRHWLPKREGAHEVGRTPGIYMAHNIITTRNYRKGSGRRGFRLPSYKGLRGACRYRFFRVLK